MQPYLDIFTRLHAASAESFLSRHGLQIKTGEGLGAAILKLLKPSWTTDGPEPLLNSNGVFFSIWVDAACVAKGRVRYNVHAKKLRLLKGPAFAAREFARSFRIEANAALKSWPKVTYPKGPITLFEGEVPLDNATFEQEVSALMDRFAELAPILDEMLVSESSVLKP
jgi:hypothetical protein